MHGEIQPLDKRRTGHEVWNRITTKERDVLQLPARGKYPNGHPCALFEKCKKAMFECSLRLKNQGHDWAEVLTEMDLLRLNISFIKHSKVGLKQKYFFPIFNNSKREFAETLAF